MIAVCGKPNAGKSTFMASCTDTSPQIANYPFTTIDPNKGVAFVRVPCPHVRLRVPCSPNNSRCKDGTRLVPVNIVDVAGLVPGAHAGKGMGNRFLSDVASADALIIVADASGGTDDNGIIVAEGSHDAVQDVAIFLSELDEWFFDVVGRNAKHAKGTATALEDFFSSLSGIGISITAAREAHAGLGLSKEPSKWLDRDIRSFSKLVRQKTKPFLIAANKCDSKFSEKSIEALREAFPPAKVIPVCADYELALRRAGKLGLVEYDGKKVALTEKGAAQPRVAEAVGKISSEIARFGSTGVCEAIDSAVLEVAGYIVAFPVEDETHYSNHFGAVLPDAVLLKNGSTPVELAAAIHADLAKHFLYAVDAERKTRMGKDHRLETGNVVRVVSAK